MSNQDYVQFLSNVKLTSLDGEFTKFFTELSFYCHIQTSKVLEDVSEEGEDPHFLNIEYYHFVVDNSEFMVSEKDAIIRFNYDCPGEKCMDINKSRWEKNLDQTTHYRDAVKKLTGHTINKPTPEAWDINDVLGVKKGGYGGKPIPGEINPDQDKIK